MNDTQIDKLIEDIRAEQHISYMEDDEVIKGYILDGKFDINEQCGAKINYEVDLKAKSLLKNYVLYARYKRLAEFKQLFVGEYAYLQAKYYKSSSL